MHPPIWVTESIRLDESDLGIHVLYEISQFPHISSVIRYLNHRGSLKSKFLHQLRPCYIIRFHALFTSASHASTETQEPKTRTQKPRPGIQNSPMEELSG